MKVIKCLAAVVVFSFVGCNSEIKIDYYFPKEYSGNVAVIYGSDEGKTPEYRDGRLQLVVPDSGIVFTSVKFVEGTLDEHFFIKNSKGGYDSLLRYDQSANEKPKKGAYFGRVMTFNCRGMSNSTIVLFFNIGDSTNEQKMRLSFEQKISEIICDHFKPKIN